MRHARAWGLQAIEARVVALAARLRDGLGELAGVRVRDLGVRRCAIVSFTVDGRSSSTVKADLARRAINVEVSPGHYTRYDMVERGMADLVRASVHYYNSEDEVDALVAAVAGRR
jgi:cysteine desulfurase / selenocysteine lyase